MRTKGQSIAGLLILSLLLLAGASLPPAGAEPMRPGPLKAPLQATESAGANPFGELSALSAASVGQADAKSVELVGQIGGATYITSTIIHVPDDYPAIQAAVDNATAGDTIIVRDGTYIENVDVNKDHLTIKSENGAEATIVQAADPNGHVFEVTADYVDISGFTIEGAAKKSGIYLANVTFQKIWYGDPRRLRGCAAIDQTPIKGV